MGIILDMVQIELVVMFVTLVGGLMGIIRPLVSMNARLTALEAQLGFLIDHLTDIGPVGYPVATKQVRGDKLV